MGRILDVVAYVTGLQRDGSDIQHDYVLRKRGYLAARAEALADFGNLLIEKDCWKSSFLPDHCSAEVIIETDLDSRPELLKLYERKGTHREITVLVTEQADLCRDVPAETESYIFEDVMHPYLSTVFAAGFGHDLRFSPIEREKTSAELRSLYQAGEKVTDRILKTLSRQGGVAPQLDELAALQGALLAHTSAANQTLQKRVERLMKRRRRA